MNYFEMLNGPTFSYLVKDLWVRAEVYIESSVALEENQNIAKNKKLKEKSRIKMGLEESKEVEIRHVIMGVNVTITQSHIAKIMNMCNIGRYVLNTKDTSPESGVIKQWLFIKYEDFGKVKNMDIEFRVPFRILIGCLIPREGNTYQISWDHKHFIWFLVNQKIINLPAYIFHHMCESIKESTQHNKNNVP